MGTIHAQTEVTSPTGGGLENAVRIAISNAALSTVTQLTVSGTIDARDFRFIRDSLTHITSLNMGTATIAAYSGMGGTAHTSPPFFGVGGGADLQADYPADTVPQYAFYKKWTTGSAFFPTTVEIKLGNLTTLTLPSTANVINQYACAGMSSLGSISLLNMNGLTRIEQYAFWKDSAATSVNLPNTLTFLGGNSFKDCAGLTSFTFPSSIDSIAYIMGFFDGCISLETVTFAEPCNISTWPPTMFSSTIAEQRPEDLLTVTVPACVTNVGTAFDYFMGTTINCNPANPVYYSQNGILYLKSDSSLVAMPKGISSFTIPASMTEIPNNYFENCSKLTTVTVLSQLTKIGNRAFYNCPVTSFTFQSSLQEIGNEAFSQTHLTSVAFSDNSNLTTLGNAVFGNCDSLQSADLSGLSTLGTQMFRINRALTSVTFSATLTKIPDQAFQQTPLVTVSLPNSVDTIGSGAFDGCERLTTINIPTSLIYLGITAFRGDTAITGTFNLPASFRYLPIDNNQGSAFIRTHAQIAVDASNPYFASENGMLFNKTKNKLYHIPNAVLPVGITLPSTADSVMAYAFTNDKGQVKKLTLPASMKYIASYGLSGAAKLDTLVSKAMTPPVCASNYYSLNNDYRWEVTGSIPRVFVPAGSKAAYLAADGWKNYPDSVYRQTGIFVNLGTGMANNVSPNGLHVAGNTATNGYVYNVTTNDYTTIPGAVNARDVNDQGWAVVDFLDSTYMVAGTPLENSGVWRNGKVYSIGLGRYGNTTTITEVRAVASAIDTAGTVYGMTYEYNTLIRVSPFSWAYNETNDDYVTDTMPFAYPYSSGDQGGRIWDISSDGQVAGGWLSRTIYGGSRTAIGWTSPTTYQFFDENNSSESKGVSPNGKYITTHKDRRAAVYDVENDNLIVFGPENTLPGESSSPTAVSDNGFVVGYHEVNNTRKAFIWSDRLGLIYFRQFIDTYMPDLEVPEDNFFNFSGELFDVPMGISSDGLTIVGWSGYSAVASKGWMIRVPDTLQLIDRPHNLTATVDITQRNVVELSWTEPTDFGSHTLDWYYVYRDGVYLDRFDATNGTSYTDNNAPVGRVTYSVAAVFDYVNQTTLNMSAQTDPVSVTIVDNYNIPFAEGFESMSFETHYWTVESNPTNAWILPANSYHGFNGVHSAIFMSNGNLQPYDLSLMSKPFDATGHNKVILAYLWRIISDVEAFLGVKDTVSVEIGVNDTWTEVMRVVINDRYNWTPVTLDISSIAADNIFRVRFRAVSGANRNAYNFDLDEFGVAFETSAAPDGVYAYRFDTESAVNVIYKDVTGSYAASYTNGRIDGTIGNEGNSIIAVNKFTTKELKPYRGKYLTSVSAYLLSDFRGTTIPSELKLAVFVNGNRVENSDITSWKGHAWNNFPLANPIAIDGSEVLLVGIEVAHGDAENKPLSMDTQTDPDNINLNANLYSEDNGVTWEHASDAGIYGNWGIIANFRDEATAATVDDDMFAAFYQIYRDGIAVDTLHYGQMFVDTASTDDSHCYKVKVFRTTGGISDFSPQVCDVNIVTAIAEIKNETLYLLIYPNPSSDWVNTNLEFSALRIFDLNGKLMLTATHGNSVNISSLTTGTYFIEAILENGSKAVAKVVKK
jgi:hypothetical protein